MIYLNNIFFSYNHIPVIKGITHRFDTGSFSAVVGPNGSGKTTLIKLMNKIIKPESGEIIIDGTDISHLTIREIAGKIAYVPQFQNNVFPATVFDTVLLGRNPFIRWTPSPRDKIIASEIIERLNLNDIAFKDINHLSGGQRQRVFIARALAQQPSIILLDEPTASLDIRHQHEILEFLGNLNKTGSVTIIMAIHDLNQAFSYCPELLILCNGEVAAKGGSEIIDENLIEKVYQVKVKIIKEAGRIYILPF